MAVLIHILHLEDDPMDAELVQARLEEVLAQSKIRMHCILFILDSVDEGLIVIDRVYRILSTNRAFCNMLGVIKNRFQCRI